MTMQTIMQTVLDNFCNAAYSKEQNNSRKAASQSKLGLTADKLKWDTTSQKSLAMQTTVL